jgi:tRNA pseudouridine55 synthase
MHGGILLLDKPCGLSSNAALQRVRTLFQRLKGGHVGSLDPLASGMLPICLGEATKVAGEIVGGRKRYQFTVELGASTATGDAEGAPLAQAPVPTLSRAAVDTLLAGFVGVTTQVPPMYAALKVQGQPLYRLARQGKTIERAARSIDLAHLQLLEMHEKRLTLDVLCSKGTYVRVLAQDIAAALGTLGYVSALRRLYVEPFDEQPMHTLEAVSANPAAAVLLPADWPLKALPAVQLDTAQAVRVRQGQQVACGGVGAARRVRLYDERQRFLGIGETDNAGVVRPRRLINLS